jgi:beta-glucosidase
MFDPPHRLPYSSIDSSALERPAHKELALKMAQQSMVLLKNDGLLPIDPSLLKKIAVLGPNAHNPQVQLGNYNGFPTRIITPLDGIREALGAEVEIYSDSVTGYYGPTPPSFDATLNHVKDADLIVYLGGISPRIEGEEMPVEAPGFFRGDRTSIRLPQIQTDLLKALKSTGKPIVFVMMTGSAIATPWESENINAILNAWYGGEFAGKAIADILFGQYNPSGRLPVTFYADNNDLPDFEDYNMANRTYRYFQGKALYPFGYGLSYTHFDYEWLRQPQSLLTAADTLACTIKISNTGGITGDEVAQIYIRYPQDSGTRLPLKELRSFARQTILAGQSEKIQIAIPLAQLAKWDEAAGKTITPQGRYTLFAGSHSEHEALSASFEIN